MNAITRLWRRFRSAITGRYVSKDYAEANPATTVSESAVDMADRMKREQHVGEYRGK